MPNSELNNLDKATICYLYLRSRDPLLSEKVFDQLTQKQQRTLASYIQQNPAFSADAIKATLDEYSELIFEHKKIHSDQEQEFKDINQVDESKDFETYYFNFLTHYPDNKVKEMLDSLPLQVVALMLKYIDQVSIIKYLKMLNEEKVKKIVNLYLKLDPPSQKYVSEFSVFLESKMEKLHSKVGVKERFDHRVVEFLELLTAYEEDISHLGLESVAAKFQDKLFNLDALADFSLTDIELVLKPFKDEKNLSYLLFKCSEKLRDAVLGMCTDRLKSLILERLKLMDKNVLAEQNKLLKFKLIHRVKDLSKHKKISSIG